MLLTLLIHMLLMYLDGRKISVNLLCFCSIGGLILDKTVSDPNLVGIVVYTPVINGESNFSPL